MKNKLLTLTLLGASTLTASNLHLLTLQYPTSIQQFGPFVDYDFYWSILPELNNAVNAGALVSFGYTECPENIPCIPHNTLIDPPPLNPNSSHSPAPEPKGFMLTAIGVGLVWLGLRKK